MSKIGYVFVMFNISKLSYTKFFSHDLLIAGISSSSFKDCIQGSNILKCSLLTIERMFKQMLVKLVELLRLLGIQNFCAELLSM